MKPILKNLAKLIKLVPLASLIHLILLIQLILLVLMSPTTSFSASVCKATLNTGDVPPVSKYSLPIPIISTSGFYGSLPGYWYTPDVLFSDYSAPKEIPVLCKDNQLLSFDNLVSTGNISNLWVITPESVHLMLDAVLGPPKLIHTANVLPIEFSGGCKNGEYPLADKLILNGMLKSENGHWISEYNKISYHYTLPDEVGIHEVQLINPKINISCASDFELSYETNITWSTPPSMPCAGSMRLMQKLEGDVHLNPDGTLTGIMIYPPPTYETTGAIVKIQSLSGTLTMPITGTIQEDASDIFADVSVAWGPTHKLTMTLFCKGINMTLPLTNPLSGTSSRIGDTEPKSPVDTNAYRFNAFNDIKTYNNPLPPSSGFSGTIIRSWKIKK